jgi:hypothetical protein
MAGEEDNDEQRSSLKSRYTRPSARRFYSLFLHLCYQRLFPPMCQGNSERPARDPVRCIQYPRTILDVLSGHAVSSRNSAAEEPSDHQLPSKPRAHPMDDEIHGHQPGLSSLSLVQDRKTLDIGRWRGIVIREPLDPRSASSCLNATVDKDFDGPLKARFQLHAAPDAKRAKKQATKPWPGRAPSDLSSSPMPHAQSTQHEL